MSGANMSMTLARRHSCPIQLLSDDLLYELLQQAIMPCPVHHIHNTISLSHVCKRWRSIILGAPVMWQHASMFITSGNDKSGMVDSLLHRSEQLPVKFYLVVRVDNHLRYSEISRAITSHAHRFTTVQVILARKASLSGVIQVLSAFLMPLLENFGFTVRGSQRCDISMSSWKGRRIHRAHRRPDNSKTSFLDWGLRRYNLTQLTLKHLDLTLVDITPILVLASSTLTHLTIYNCAYGSMDHQVISRITLPHLVSLSLGYRSPILVIPLIRVLNLPNLLYLSVRDIGRCPDGTTPSTMLDFPMFRSTLMIKDASALLQELCAFDSICCLKLHGVICPATPTSQYSITLKHLFSGLQSLSLMLCDAAFLTVLLDATSSLPVEHLETLSELAITADHYPLFLQYLTLRASRGLPLLERLTVNPRMAPLHLFSDDFTRSFEVLSHAGNYPEEMHCHAV